MHCIDRKQGIVSCRVSSEKIMTIISERTIRKLKTQKKMTPDTGLFCDNYCSPFTLRDIDICSGFQSK